MVSVRETGRFSVLGLHPTWRWLPAASVAVAYLCTLAFAPKPLLGGDSGMYKDQNVLHNWDRIPETITGQWFRPIFPVVPNEILGSYWAIEFAQLFLLGAAAVWTSWRITNVPRGTTAGVVSGFAAGAILASGSIVGFAANILSEAWTYIFVILFIGAVTDIGRIFEWTWRKWVVVTCLGLAVTLSRPYLLLIVGATLLAGVAIQSRGGRTWAGAVKALVSLLVAGLVGALWWVSSENYWEAHNIGHTPSGAVYELSEFSPVSKEFARWIMRESPPPACLTIRPPFPADAAGLWEHIMPLALKCPAAMGWLTNAGHSYTRFLLTHPTMLLRSAMWAVPRGFSTTIPPEIVTVVPPPVTDALLGRYVGAATGSNYDDWERSDAVAIQDPMWGVLVVLIAAVVVGLVKRGSSAHVQRAARFTVIALGALATGAWVSVWEANTLQEMGRLGSPMNIALRLSIILAVTSLIAEVVELRRSATAKS